MSDQDQTPDEAQDDKLYPDPSKDEKAALKLKHKAKRLFEFKVGSNIVLCKKISPVVWKRVQANENAEADEKEDTAAIVLNDTVVYPDREKLTELLAEYPALAEPIGIDLIRVARGDEAKRGKPV